MAANPNDTASTFKSQLNRLYELQELDNEITDFEDEREKIPAQFEKQEGQLLKKRKSQEEKENQIQLVEDEIAEKRRSLELEMLKLKNTRNKETAIQNIKQYEAFVKEIETQEETGDELGDEIKALEARLGELKKDLGEVEGAIAEIIAEQNSKRAQLEERLSELDKTLEEMYDRRDEMAETIDEDLYYKYEYIAERKQGVAVAEVAHGHCLNCNMAIPPQMYNELIRGDQLMTCPACNVILVYLGDPVVND